MKKVFSASFLALALFMATLTPVGESVTRSTMPESIEESFQTQDASAWTTRSIWYGTRVRVYFNKYETSLIAGAGIAGGLGPWYVRALVIGYSSLAAYYRNTGRCLWVEYSPILGVPNITAVGYHSGWRC